MLEIGGMKLSEDELSTVIDNYLSSRKYIMWARWDIAQEGPSRVDARAWFMEQLAGIEQFLPQREEEENVRPLRKVAPRLLVAVGD